MRDPKLFLAGAMAGVSLILFSERPAGAQAEPLWPTFAISAGAFLAESDSTLRVDATELQVGTEVDFEGDLGLDEEETLVSARLEWRFAKRHQLALSYFASDREGGGRLERTIVVDDTVFPVGLDVESALERRQIELAYTGWLVREESFGAGLSLGIVHYDLDASIRGRVQIGPFPFFREESWSESAPIPMIGAELRGAPLDRLVLFGRVRYLPRVKVEQVEGEALGFTAGAEFRIVGPLAVGVGYESDSLELEADEEEWHGKADLDLDGFRVYLRAAF
jgi:hypothetical protein